MVKPLEETTGINIYNFRLGKDFLNVTQKATRDKIIELHKN